MLRNKYLQKEETRTLLATRPFVFEVIFHSVLLRCSFSFILSYFFQGDKHACLIRMTLFLFNWED